MLTAEQEAELRDWVMEQRRSEARLAVSEKMVRIEARHRWGIPASSKWVNGWMERQRLCMRLRTTHKEIDTERMGEVKQQYQNKMARLFNTVSHHLIFNTDETAVFFDAPHNRTIDEIGARNVEIWAHRALRRPHICCDVHQLLRSDHAATCGAHMQRDKRVQEDRYVHVQVVRHATRRRGCSVGGYVDHSPIQGLAGQ